MEPDPSVLIQGGIRRVISRPVEAVLIFNERYPSERVAIGNNIQSWYFWSGRVGWFPPYPVHQDSSGLQTYT